MCRAMCVRVGRLGLVALTMFVVVAGCTAQPSQPVESRGRRLETVRAEIRDAKARVGDAVSALAGVVNAPQRDLQARYSAFGEELKRLEMAVQRARDRRLDMSARRDQYLAAWNMKLAGMLPGDERQQAESDLRMVREIFSRLEERFQEGREAAASLLENMRDANRFLAGDLSVAAARSLTEMLEEVKTAQEQLNEALDGADKQVEQLITFAAERRGP